MVKLVVLVIYVCLQNQLDLGVYIWNCEKKIEFCEMGQKWVVCQFERYLNLGFVVFVSWIEKFDEYRCYYVV